MGLLGNGVKLIARSWRVKIMTKATNTRKGTWKLVFCTVYRHWRTGKLMRASDYGYKAWPFKVLVPNTP